MQTLHIVGRNLSGRTLNIFGGHVYGIHYVFLIIPVSYYSCLMGIILNRCCICLVIFPGRLCSLRVYDFWRILLIFGEHLSRYKLNILAGIIPSLVGILLGRHYDLWRVLHTFGRRQL